MIATCTFLVLMSLSSPVAAWHILQPHGPSQACYTTTAQSRRTFLFDIPSTATAVVALLGPPLVEPVYAESLTSDVALDQWKRSQIVIDELLKNWPTIAQGGGDAIRRELGTQGIASPLFQIEKSLRVLREDAKDLIEFTEQEEEFLLALSRADSMAYSANFAGGSGKPTPPAVYIEKSQKEVIELQKIAKSLSALLQ